MLTKRAISHCWKYLKWWGAHTYRRDLNPLLYSWLHLLQIPHVLMTRLSTQIYLDYFCTALTHFSVVLNCLPILSWVMNVNRSPRRQGISLLWDEKNLIKFSWKMLNFMLLLLIVFLSHMVRTITSIFFWNSYCLFFTKWSSREYSKKIWIIEKLLFYFSLASFSLFHSDACLVHRGKWMCHDDAIICNYSFPPVILMIVCLSTFLSLGRVTFA